MANQGKKASGSDRAKGCGCLAVIVVIVVIVIAAASSGGSGKTPKQQAQAYIKKVNNDVNVVQASMQTQQIALGLAIKDPSSSNVDQLAQLAQKAHDTINNTKDDFAVAGDIGSSNLDNAETEIFAAANDLKNAEGALVAYTGNPNPATLAHFTSQYQNAVGEWNDGVKRVWSVAGESNPPTV